MTCRRPSDGLTKVAFDKRADAKRVARQRGMRAYRCPDSHPAHWHLTHQSNAQAKEHNMLDSIEEPTPLQGERRRSIYRLHYSGGESIEIIALSAREAVQLVGRGRPERIDNVSLSNELSEGKLP